MIKLPNWLNREYIEFAIRSKQKDPSIKIIQINVSPAIASGENFASVIYRIEIEYVGNSVASPRKNSYVLKTCFDGEEELRRQIFESFNLYNHELVMYDSILPRMMSILNSGGLDEYLIPAVIKTDFHRKCILFEDLRLSNFVMKKKSVGFDMAHIKLILRNVARLHASSAKLNEVKPGVLPTFDRGIFNKYTDALVPFYQMLLTACGHVVKNWLGYEQYGQKLLKLNLKERAIDVYTAKDEHFNCLTHGDLWSNNIMFKYDKNNEPAGMVFVDFQFSSWCSPAVDLHYFFHTSVADELLEFHEEELVQYYHDCLIDTLKRIDFKEDIPTWQQFFKQYMDKSFCAVTSACVLLPMVLTEVKLDDSKLLYSDADYEDYAEVRESLYKSERVQKVLKRLLPIFDKHGLLD